MDQIKVSDVAKPENENFLTLYNPPHAMQPARVSKTRYFIFVDHGLHPV